ncbi:hypothetical protein K1719_000646 [Acacia pycnantha]|nr:hypothetical protein K1719_000646 [Acacia pycnantha]
MLRQKDEEIAQAAKKRMELEEFLSRLEEENKAWCKEAQEKEAITLSLHNTLEQVKNGVAAEDARSCCAARNPDNYQKLQKGLILVANFNKNSGHNRLLGDAIASCARASSSPECMIETT